MAGQYHLKVHVMKIAILPGDGIGPEITAQAVKVLDALGESFEMETMEVGGAGYAAHGHPLPPATLALAKAADAVLFGAVGDYQYDNLERSLRRNKPSWDCARSWVCSPTCARRSCIPSWPARPR